MTKQTDVQNGQTVTESLTLLTGPDGPSYLALDAPIYTDSLLENTSGNGTNVNSVIIINNQLYPSSGGSLSISSTSGSIGTGNPGLSIDSTHCKLSDGSGSTAQLSINSGIVNITNPLTVNSITQPQFYNSTFSAASPVSIGIDFTTNSFSYAEIKVMFYASDGNNDVTITSNTGTMSEVNSVLFQNNNSSYSFYTTAYFAKYTERNINGISTIRIIRPSGVDGSYGYRCHYSIESVYCYAGIGASKLTGYGYIDISSATSLADIQLNPASGTLSGTYNIQYYY